MRLQGGGHERDEAWGHELLPDHSAHERPMENSHEA